MERIVEKRKTKLQSNSGVTILFALLLFMVASVVSITILASAYSSVKRTHSTKEMTQANLTLDSAALLLKNEFGGASYEIGFTKNNDGSYNYNTSGSTSEELFKKEVAGISYAIATSSSSDDIKTKINGGAYNFTVQVSDDEVEDVSVNTAYVPKSEGYVILFTLSTTDDQQMYVAFNIHADETSTGFYTYKKTVTWTYWQASGKVIAQ